MAIVGIIAVPLLFRLTIGLFKQDRNRCWLGVVAAASLATSFWHVSISGGVGLRVSLLLPFVILFFLPMGLFFLFLPRAFVDRIEDVTLTAHQTSLGPFYLLEHLVQAIRLFVDASGILARYTLTTRPLFDWFSVVGCRYLVTKANRCQII